jgi:NADP-dependent 3-hydroxy acid dehydrogenase YdfG
MTSFPFTSALVTGASSGIGEEITRQLADAGVPTVVVARRGERLRRLANELPGIEVLEADLLDAEALAAVGARLMDPERPI